MEEIIREALDEHDKEYNLVKEDEDGDYKVNFAGSMPDLGVELMESLRDEGLYVVAVSTWLNTIWFASNASRA